MNKFFILIIFFAFATNAFAQRKYKAYKRPSPSNQEIGLSLGVSNYLGDLAWKGKIPIIHESNPKAFRPAGGVYYRSNFTKFTSFRASLGMGELTGTDAQTNNDPARVNRNLSFKSVVIEASVMFEWNIAPYLIGDKKRPFTPYLGIGLAGFYFNPKAELNGRWVALQPLGTEGQGIIDGKSKYSNFQFAIPGAVGIKANLGKKFALGLEFQYRMTFTDYLDDVSSENFVSSDIFYDNYITAVAADADALSYRAIDPTISPRETDQRGNPNNNDNYYFIFVNLSYKIGKKNTGCNTFR